MSATVERPDWIGPDGQPMRRLELHLSYACPQHCWFCSEEQRLREHREHTVTWGRIARTLREHRERGVTSVHLTGGEPTIHPRFGDALALARKLGMRTSVGTNGHTLCREEAARAALPLLDEVMFSLHGPTPEVHDEQTGAAGSFDRVCEAMRLCGRLAPKVERFCNVVVTRVNIDHLRATVALAESLGAGLVLLSNPTPEGAAEARYGELAVDFAGLDSKLGDAVRGALRAVVRFFGVPLCLLGEHAMLSNDLHWDPRVTVEWVSRPGKVVFEALYNWAPTRRRIHVGPCRDCAWKGLCPGVFDTAAKLWPHAALRPQREAGGSGP
ncbi:MAG: radical SAM protein [bacterium]